MTEQEVVALALATAQQQGWPEKGRISVTGGRKYVLFGAYCWWVSLHYMRANLYAQITVDDRTGQVIDISSRPWKSGRVRPPDGDPNQ